MLPPDSLRLLPASQFSSAQLLDIYNRARADYLVPMPMDATRLAEYVRLYDVSLENSLVAIQGDEMLGIGMLGLRPGRAWVTRLGVLAGTRRGGLGAALVTGLLERAASLGIGFSMLEVIKDNHPAHGLFLKLGFSDVGELVLLERHAGAPPAGPDADIDLLDAPGALALARQHLGALPWTNQAETLGNFEEVSGFRLSLADGTRGWLVYHAGAVALSHFVYQTEQGNPLSMAQAFLSHLHQRHPRLAAHIENIRAGDPHLPAFYQAGYTEIFRRIEMWRGSPPAGLQMPVFRA